MTRRTLANRSGAAAFLCYHSVSGGGPPFLSLPPELFERQLHMLSRAGWKSGTTADLHALAAGRRLDAPRAFLTFDDGFEDNCTVALPLLETYGFTAIVYVIPPLVDAGGALAWPEVEERRAAHPQVMRSMTWPMVERLVEAGCEIGAHTLTHPHLPDLGDEQLREELAESRRLIADRLGSCESVAYPFGDWSPRVAAAAAETGYAFGFTMPRDAQRGAPALTLPRVAVDHRDDPRRLRMKLSAPGRAALLSPVRPAARSLLRAARG
jgi:peptidoglycan/xylan/chitin deacetylase (PgdA/CDA1 family)